MDEGRPDPRGGIDGVTVDAERRAPGSAGWAAGLLVAFGAATLLHWFVASYHLVGQTAVDLGFSLALLATTALVARALLRRRRWAAWAALALASIGLFFVAPVTGTILLGGGTDPIGTGWDVVYFPLTSAILVAVIVALRRAWAELDGHGSS